MVHYCNPLLWLQDNEPEFFAAVNNLCAAIRFTNRTTFILPSKEIREQFISLVEKGNIADDDKAQEILSAHLINKQFDIGELLSGNIYTSDRSMLQAGEVSGGATKNTQSVTFSNHSTILQVPKDGLNRRGQPIILIATGPVPKKGVSDGPSRGRERHKGNEGNEGNKGNEGNEESKPRRRVRNMDNKEGVEGGSYDSDKPIGGMREAVFKLLSDEHMKHFIKKHGDPPIYMYMVSLLNFIKESHKDVYNAIRPLIDLNPFVTAVILLQPYQKSGPYILDDDLIIAWGGNKDNYDALRDDWYSHFVGQPYESRIRNMLEAIDNIRCKILESSSTTEFNKLLVDTYNKLYETGKVDGVEVLSDATRKLFKNGYGLMWCDEMRFLVSRALKTIDDNGFYLNLNKFKSILNCIMNMNVDKFSTTSTLFNVPNGINKKEIFNAWLIQFVNSNDFLMGCGQGYKEFKKVVPTTNTSGVDGGADVFDAGFEKISALEKVSNTQPSHSGYNGGGRPTSGPRTARKAANNRRKIRHNKTIEHSDST